MKARKMLLAGVMVAFIGITLCCDSAEATPYSASQMLNWLDGGFSGTVKQKIKKVAVYKPSKHLVNTVDGNNCRDESGELGTSMVCGGCGAWIDTIIQNSIEFENQSAGTHTAYTYLFDNRRVCINDHSSMHTQSTQIHFMDELYEITEIEQ